MKKFAIFCLVSVVSFSTYAQTFNSFYSTILENTSQTNILNDLTTFESFGIKNVGSTRLTDTETWITSRYQNLGYTDVVLQPFSYSAGTSNNIIVTKTGTVYPNTYLIIDGHYDTINGAGTNDNGSGTVLILELARLLKDINTEYSIKFIHFSGEEDGLIGSNYYVNNTVIPQDLDIKLVLNIDEVGGLAGTNNNTIVCERDLSSPSSNNAASNAFTNDLATLIELYTNLNTEISNAYASDYIPFENNGEIITGLYEKNETPYAHTANDLLVNMDVPYLYEVTKGTIGAALEFAVAYETLSLEEASNLDHLIRISPNPSDNFLTISFSKPLDQVVDFKIIDMLGKQVYKSTLREQTQNIAIDNLVAAHYLGVFKINNKRLIKKLIIE
ncbi:M28 family peptidase [Psychroserpens ponticola]|uniref:M28 family peptidase n=1 Tax=Psychroserpens ponticola TaxID=2932268 RepID=A0ABY7RZ72_9FLAO|nr:M28 family peptidase [Psychroserpens ponticola]WCO02382.1 M28 family peptidase [Psychroserpens ponticola]